MTETLVYEDSTRSSLLKLLTEVPNGILHEKALEHLKELDRQSSKLKLRHLTEELNHFLSHSDTSETDI